MFISDFAIKRPIITVVAMMALSVFGIVALLQLKTDEFPEVVAADRRRWRFPTRAPRRTPSSARSSTRSRSRSPRSAASSRSSRARSTASASIIVEFDFSKDLQEATQDIRDGISQIRNDLPTEMEEPILTQFDPNDLPIVSLALTSTTLTGAELTQHRRSRHHAASCAASPASPRCTSSAASSAS